MLKNHFKTAFRNLWNNKGYTVINSVGLAVGLTVFVLVLLYVNYERSYDKWDDQLHRVYRAGINEDGEKSFEVQYPLGTFFADNCPEVEGVTRVRIAGESLISNDKTELFTQKVISADSNFFAVFPYKFIFGDARTALNRPQAVVITRDFSEAVFGKQDPVGKLLTFDRKEEYTITGVVEKTGPSHLDFDVCRSYHSTYFASNWFMKNHNTYVLLRPDTRIDLLEEKSASVYSRNSATEGKDKAQVFFEPVGRIHLEPAADRQGMPPGSVYDFQAGNNRPLLIFSMVGIFVLLLACINYTNMAVARAGRRAKESGLRKVLGSSRKQLVVQFLTEAFIQSLIALLIALCCTLLLTDILNANFRLSLSLWSDVNNQYNIRLLMQVIGIVLAVTLISGAYPAYLLSGYTPARVLKGSITQNSKGHWLRNGLVIIQYGIATCFIISILIVSLQLHFMHTHDPGFDSSQVLRIQVRNLKLLPGQPGDQSGFIEDGLAKIPGIRAVSMSGSYPGRPVINLQEAVFEARPDSLPMSFNFIGFGYFDVLGMQLIKGRDLSPDFAGDSVDNALINEAAASRLGWQDPIGKKIGIVGRKYNVVGVVRNNYSSGYGSVIPPEIYAIGVNPGNFYGYDNVLLKTDGSRTADVLAGLTKLWKTVQPDYPIRYSWLDEDFARLMEKHERFGKLAGYLTIAALSIAMMGLFALSAFTAEQRVKEIGIRKILGASVSGILKLLSADFVKLVITAIIIAAPVSWWAMSAWLNDFAYRIELEPWMFLIAGSIAILIALLTVSFQAIKAALANPVESLRGE